MDNETATPVQDAGAVTQTQTAEAVSTQNAGTAGADPQTSTAEGKDSQNVADTAESAETTSQEGAQAQTEGESKSPDQGRHQVPFEERVNQVVEKRLAELTAQKQQQEEATKIPFIDVDLARLERELLAPAEEEIAILRAEGRYLEAANVERKRNELLQQLADNEAKKQEWLRAQGEAKRTQEFYDAAQKDLDACASTYRGQYKIPEEIWAEGRTFFDKAQASDPILKRKFNDLILSGRRMEAVDFAYSYVKEHMGKEQQALIDQKNKAKETLPPGKGSMPTTVDSKAEVEKLLAIAQKTGRDEDYLNYMNAKNAAKRQT